MARTDEAAAKPRAWWFSRQGLAPGTAPKTILECLRTAGWLVTGGSTGVYLSMRARMPGFSRAAVDRAAMDATRFAHGAFAPCRTVTGISRNAL